jgi:hypothetical protein
MDINNRSAMAGKKIRVKPGMELKFSYYVMRMGL